VFGVIHFVYLQNLLATDDDERLIQREPQDFIRSKYRAFSNTRGLTKLRCIVGDTPGAQLFGLTGYCYGGKPCPGRNKFGSKLVCTGKALSPQTRIPSCLKQNYQIHRRF